MLGTGHAAVTRCYNTCFALRDGSDFFLVDAGGGNEILRRLDAAGLELSHLRGMFVTHAHSDHILGAVWILRMMDGLLKKSPPEEPFRIWGHDEVQSDLRWFCEQLLSNGGKPFGYGAGNIKLTEVRDGEQFTCMGMSFTAFDINSTKKKQFGFRAEIDGRRLVCLGDEPCSPGCREQAGNADLLMSEAFCLERDESRFQAHKKSHSTAIEAAETAVSLGARALLLYHTEDTDLEHRKENYQREAARVFSGRIIVPDDMETVEI